MVCKDELCASFKNLRSADRIDLMCGLLQLCVPLELRFIGSYLEDLARKDYSELKEFETKANDSEVLRETPVNEATKDSCGALNVYVSLLHSDNSFCAHVLFNMLRGLKDLIQDAVNQSSSSDKPAMCDFEMADDILLLFTMALHHPAFTFSQRFQLYSDRKALKTLLNDSTVCIPGEKNGVNVEGQSSLRIKAGYNEDEEPGCNAIRSASVHNSTQLGTEPESVFVKEIGLKPTTSADSRQDYVLEVSWSDNSVTRVTKTYQELSEFHRQLIRMFPSYAGAYKQERVIPFFPQDKNHHILENLKDYFRKISLLPENFLRCDLMMEFFQDKPSKSLSSSSSLVTVNSVTPSTTNLTASSSQCSITSRNGAGSGETTSISNTNVAEEESKPRGNHGNHIRSLTVYNSHMAAEHGTKRGADMAGKPLRPHMTTAAAKPHVVPVMATSGPAARHPWLAAQYSTILQSTRVSENAVVCSSPSVASHSLSPHSPSVSPPQSITSGSSPVELASSQNNTSEVWLKQKHFHRHPDAVAANSCSKLQTIEQDVEHFSQDNIISAVHRSKSDVDQKRILIANAVPLVAGGVSGNALISSSSTDCQSVLWCLQGQERLPTPIMTLNNLVPSVPLGIVSGVPLRGPPPGLYPAVAYARLDAEMLDDIDQDKSLRDEVCFTANDGSDYVDKSLFVPITQNLAANPVLENHVFNPSSLRPFASSRESVTSQCILVPSSSIVKTGTLMPATSQTNLVTKQARPILGASHRANVKASHQSDSNGEKHCTTLALEASVLSTKATASTTAAMVTITTQSMVLCDGSQAGEPVGHSSPALVSPEGGFTRPTSLNIPSAMNRRSKMSNADAKGGSAFRISASRSVAAVSSSGVETMPRGTVSFYHNPDVVPISSPYPLPGQVLMQRISSLPSATQSFPVLPGPPSIPTLPPMMTPGGASMPSAIPTPSTTPPILPLPPGNGSANGGACTSCCQCLQCSVQPHPGMPYSYPFMWQGHLFPTHNTFTFVNGFINSHNLSFPPPSLPPHVPVAAPTFNGISSEILFNMTQNQQPPPHLNHPPMMGSPLFTTSQCVPFNPNYPPPIHPHSLTAVAKLKQCCPNCGANDHSLGACTETKTSVLQHAAQFRLNPSAKQSSD